MDYINLPIDNYFAMLVSLTTKIEKLFKMKFSTRKR